MTCSEHVRGTAVCAVHVCTVLCLLVHAHMHTCHAHRDVRHATSTSQTSDDVRTRQEHAARTEANWSELGTEYLEEIPTTVQTAPVRDHTPARDPAERPYLEKIFQKYGRGGVLTFEGFEHLLQSLGLGDIVISDHGLQQHNVGGEFRDIHENHDHGSSHRGDDSHKHSHHADESRDHHSDGDGDSHESQDHNHESHDHDHESHDHDHESHDHDHSEHSSDSDQLEIVHNQHNNDDHQHNHHDLDPDNQGHEGHDHDDEVPPAYNHRSGAINKDDVLGGHSDVDTEESKPHQPHSREIDSERSPQGEEFGRHDDHFSSHEEHFESHDDHLGSHEDDLGSHEDDVGSHEDDLGSHEDDVGSHEDDLESHEDDFDIEGQDVDHSTHSHNVSRNDSHNISHGIPSSSQTSHSTAQSTNTDPSHTHSSKSELPHDSHTNYNHSGDSHNTHNHNGDSHNAHNHSNNVGNVNNNLDSSESQPIGETSFTSDNNSDTRDHVPRDSHKRSQTVPAQKGASSAETKGKVKTDPSRNSDTVETPAPTAETPAPTETTPAATKTTPTPTEPTIFTKEASESGNSFSGWAGSGSHVITNDRAVFGDEVHEDTEGEPPVGEGGEGDKRSVPQPRDVDGGRSSTFKDSAQSAGSTVGGAAGRRSTPHAPQDSTADSGVGGATGHRSTPHSSSDSQRHSRRHDRSSLAGQRKGKQKRSRRARSVDGTNGLTDTGKVNVNKRSVNDNNNNNDDDDNQCMKPLSLLQKFNLLPTDSITQEVFVQLCPAIIFQLDAHVCADQQHGEAEKHSQSESDPSHLHSDSLDHHDHDHNNDHSNGPEVKAKHNNHQVSLQVWGYAFLAVLVISLVGLLGVAVVPVMQKVFYNHLLQFLVALAVGSLVGDALLHLMPHAMLPHDHGTHSGVSDHDHGAPLVSASHDAHAGEAHVGEAHAGEAHAGEAHTQQGVWLGLVAVGGIYFFFLTERLMGIISKWRSNIRKNKKKRLRSPPKSPKSPRLYRTEEEREQLAEVGMKLSSHEDRVRSCLYRSDEVRQIEDMCQRKEDRSCEEMMMVVHPSKRIRDIAEEAHEDIEEMHRACELEEMHRTCTDVESTTLSPQNSINESHLKENGHGGQRRSFHGHSHGHGHGHAHELPKSVSAVAWMVIMGDGLHNFCDGLAIGAAFANSITGGLSTSVAVFCHELPHELGDFAVLLRAGMSVKNALIYNCVSSILCFLGMVVGVCAGNIGSVSLWIFALAAGMFIYIALVDMLPEMAAVEPKAGENPFIHLGLQNLGLLCGITIMLLIALYEDKIKIPHFEP